MKRQFFPAWIIWVSSLLFVLAACIGGGVAGWLLFGQSMEAAVSPRQVTMEAISITSQPTPTPLTVQPQINDLEAQIESIYERVSPGVVNITTRSFELDFFMRPVPREGSGSGFFYDSNGHIVTNYHVVQDVQEVQVTLADGRSMPAKVVGTDPSNDLAVIKVAIAPDEVHVLSIDEDLEVKVGHFVVAIGNPFGLERTMTLGIVSSLGRVIESPNQRFIGEVIQTDAAVNPGNSGGPLLNLAGEVVGVNSAILSPSGASAGIGFAIPAQTVQRIVPSLIAEGRYPHPTLGVQMYELKAETVRLLQQVGIDVPVDEGLLVVQTMQRGVLRGGDNLVRVGNKIVPIGGDIIIALDGQPITTIRDLMVYLETQKAVGDTVDVTIIRDGEEQVVQVVLVELVM
jgi:S1-C subfamily serine protease